MEPSPAGTPAGPAAGAFAGTWNHLPSAWAIPTADGTFRTGPVAKVIHNFGRADQVDRAALSRLVASISRSLDPAEAAGAASAGEVEVLDSRRMGGAWVLARLWERLRIGAAILKVAESRRLDGAATERVIFALVAQRALEPASKLAATTWVAGRVFLEGCPGFR